VIGFSDPDPGASLAHRAIDYDPRSEAAQSNNRRGNNVDKCRFPPRKIFAHHKFGTGQCADGTLPQNTVEYRADGAGSALRGKGLRALAGWTFRAHLARGKALVKP
jgi:hypothetical protein